MTDTKGPYMFRQPTLPSPTDGDGVGGRFMERSGPSMLLPTRGLSMYDTSISIKKLSRVTNKQDLAAGLRKREAAVTALKQKMSEDWEPEYTPITIEPPAYRKGDYLAKTSRVSSAMILTDVEVVRKTKIVCTMGPACWSEEGLGALMGAGMDVARFNFSHGTHEQHKEVLDRVRKVAAAKDRHIGLALDTKGPEIRTAMLKDGKDIKLEEGQDITIVAVGDSYTSWEGSKDEATGETRIGLSYAKLCRFVKPGNTILLSDGTITIKVTQILNDHELKGTVLNTHKLGQRKNCNLPGVVVDLPVLGPKDIDDVQNFACKHGMDFVFASFVQTADDVRFIRSVLRQGGGGGIKIIVKIESQAGIKHFDEILAETDGVMVARGDLAMELPPEKVALAQKMIINKCQVAGKIVICATQMMESMIDNPAPSRAEMTDVANAVFDGTGAVMLSGETANGKFPSLVVTTMADIVANTELGVNYEDTYRVIRHQNAGRSVVPAAEAVLSGVAQQAVLFCEDRDGDGVISRNEGCLAIVLTQTGAASALVSKYRPPCPVVVVSPNDNVLRQASGFYGQYPCKLAFNKEPQAIVYKAIEYALAKGLAVDGIKVIVVTGGALPSADQAPVVTVENLGMRAMSFIFRSSHTPTQYRSPFAGNSTICSQNVIIDTAELSQPSAKSAARRATKIVATIGPASWEPDMMAKLVDAGINVARFNVKHGTMEENQQLLDMYREVVQERAQKNQQRLGLHGLLSPESNMRGVMISLKGHEIRTARLTADTADVKAGDEVVFEGVGDEYTSYFSGKSFIGTGPLTIGLSYERVGTAVQPGDIILVDDGALKVEVTKVLSDESVAGKALNAHTLREMALALVPNAYKDEPAVLSERDLSHIAFAAVNQADYISVPFVSSAEQVHQVRAALDAAGGPNVKIITQIDTADAIRAYDSILAASDGIMVSRSNLGMGIPSSKVTLAQKWMIQKANFAGKPVLVAGQVMEGMASNLRPSRPEITDIVNCVYDGADGIVLMQETSCGEFADVCIKTTAQIINDAEVHIDYQRQYDYLRNYTPKPMPTLEAQASSAVKSLLDMGGSVLAVITDSTHPVRLLAKYRPGVPILVVTRLTSVASQCSLINGAVPIVVPVDDYETSELVERAIHFCRKYGLAAFQPDDDEADQLVVLCGPADQPFLEPSCFNMGEVFALVFGDEAAGLGPPKGYRGNFTIAYRSTKVGMDLITSPVKTPRKTKIFCTMGPACWSEEGLGALMDAGMDVARFNFSHGTHEQHKEVLDRVRKVAAANNRQVACMLDTKGPEIRTAMLRDHKPIDLQAGQDITIVAVGDGYTSWEGYKDEATGETKIGLSYQRLCQDVKEGGRILLADGSVTIQVTQILNDKELKGTVLNTKTLGERKNCNLPGVLVQLPVLGPKDIDDVQNFACKHGMDFVAASFVQSADDVKFIRKTLDAAGGKHIGIISKIESWHGVTNFDDILRLSDGIMVARGDLAMEVPSEKVALAQKMLTTKANIAGKFCVTATQMLESMTSSPLPTRAEMTDVANAVLDGTDAVMLSGETANGSFPAKAVKTMAAIVANAEVGVNSYQTYHFIRNFTDKPMSTSEAVLGAATKNSIDLDAGLILVMTHSGIPPHLVAKYRPRCPVVVMTDSAQVARACAPWYALVAYLVKQLPTSRDDLKYDLALEAAIITAVQMELCPPGKEVVVVHGLDMLHVDGAPMIYTKVAPGRGLSASEAARAPKTLSLRTTAIAMDDVLSYEVHTRATKIVCTLGPACWSEEGLGALMDAGMDVARFNFSHGTHEQHKEVLDRLRNVAEERGRRIACLLDTKGPEIRTAMLKGGKNLELQQGQEVVLVAVGADYKTWEGGMDGSGPAKIGISYEKLCQSVRPGNIIKMADGSLSIEVLEILGDKELRGKCLNSKSLGQNKNVNLPGVVVDLPVLTTKDIDDLVNFAVRNRMDFVAASFVQTADDVRFIRLVLDKSGGQDVKIICKIENQAGLENYDDILVHADGIMVARGDLAMEVPSEKVALAQKMMVTKANIAGKMVVTATQMLESMTSSPLPTRAEMTDVANAVFDGTDAVMLSGETANGSFPTKAVETMAAIVGNAEVANSYTSTTSFLSDHTMKPAMRMEAVSVAVAQAVVDSNAQLIVTLSATGEAPRLVSKYRPPVPQIVVTDSVRVANQCNAQFGQHGLVVDDLCDVGKLTDEALEFAQVEGLWQGEGLVLVLSGRYEANADLQPMLTASEPLEPAPALLKRTFSSIA